MGVKLPRAKARNLLLSFCYRLMRLPVMSTHKKMRLMLDLNWIFWRLAHEQSHRLIDYKAHPSRLKSRDFIVQHLWPEAKVLDLGCGNGMVAEFLAPHVDRVTGIDSDANAIEQAKARVTADNVDFSTSEVRQYLAGANLDYQVLILSHILEHLDDPEEFLQRHAAFFQFIYIEVPDFEVNYLNLYRQRFDTDLIYTDADHVSEFDRDELRALIQSVGLEEVDSEFRYGVQKYWLRNPSAALFPGIDSG
jgi:SAM-dependent methyltransferase